MLLEDTVDSGRLDSIMKFDPECELVSFHLLLFVFMFNCLCSQDLEEIDGDLEKFQGDDIVKGALEKGVDLRFYSRHIDQELRTAESASIKDCRPPCVGQICG